MSKTFKTDRAYFAHKNKKAKGLNPADGDFEELMWELNTTGQRFGNNRKMHAKAKVDQRRADRRQRERETDLFFD